MDVVDLTCKPGVAGSVNRICQAGIICMIDLTDLIDYMDVTGSIALPHFIDSHA